MKTVEKDGLVLELRKNTYAYGGGTAISLVVHDFTEDYRDDYLIGEPFSNVTVNLPGLHPDEFALDHDFTNWISNEIIHKVLEILTEETDPHRIIPSGFVHFPVYTFRKEILDWDPEKEVQHA